MLGRICCLPAEMGPETQGITLLVVVLFGVCPAVRNTKYICGAEKDGPCSEK